jgi:hypothetical protein
MERAFAAPSSSVSGISGASSNTVGVGADGSGGARIPPMSTTNEIKAPATSTTTSSTSATTSTTTSETAERATERKLLISTAASMNVHRRIIDHGMYV